MFSRKVPLMGTGLGFRIKTAREMAGLTQPELGTKIGVGRSAIAKYEREELGVSLDGLKRISEATQCNLAWLIGEPEAPHSVTPAPPDTMLALSVVVQAVEEADELRSDLTELVSAFRSVAPASKLSPEVQALLDKYPDDPARERVLAAEASRAMGSIVPGELDVPPVKIKTTKKKKGE